jgi:tetratricopeptide (TPR) repeat protein/TolB-like protein
MCDDDFRADRSPVTLRPVLGAVLGLLISTAALAQPASVPSPQPSSTRYLVIPFENMTRDPRVYWLSEGSAIILTDDLLGLGRSAITRDDRLRAFDRLRVPNVPTLSHATMIRLGQIVGAAQVVLGSFELRDDVLTVRARTIRLDTGRISADIAEVGSLADVFGVFGHVAQRIAPESRVPTVLMEQVHPPVPALEQFVKGLVAQAPATKEAFLTQAVKQAPTFQRARIALWDVYTDQSKHREALAIVREVAPTSRLARQARFLASLSLISLGQLQEAYDALSQLNATTPDSALFNNLGVIQMRRPPGAGGRAISFFNEAARLDNTDSDLFFNLGYAFFTDRDMPAAVYWLREAVRRNPADEQAHYILGVALQATGSPAEGGREKELARRLSSTFSEWDRQSPSVPRGLERIKADVDVPAALRVDNVIVAAGQRDQQEVAGIHLENGRRLSQAERDADAIAELRRAIYLAPYQHEAHLLLGEVYLRDGRIDEAIDELKISIWSQDTLAAHLTLAEAFIAAHNTEGARSELQAALTRDPANSRAKQLLTELP